MLFSVCVGVGVGLAGEGIACADSHLGIAWPASIGKPNSRPEGEDCGNDPERFFDCWHGGRWWGLDDGQGLDDFQRLGIEMDHAVQASSALAGLLFNFGRQVVFLPARREAVRVDDDTRSEVAPVFYFVGSHDVGMGWGLE